MKEELLKLKFEFYQSAKFLPFTPLSEKNIIKSSKHPYFQMDSIRTDEETFVKNFANPLYSVLKEYLMVVIERCGDKISLKMFFGFKRRTVGKTWFKTSKNCKFLVVNLNKGNFYNGAILEYQKKKKNSKRIQQNFFLNSPVASFEISLKNYLSRFLKSENESKSKSILQIFFSLIDGEKNFNELTFDERLFKFYLDKKKIKYPNNFRIFINSLNDKLIKKILAKNDNKLVESVMKRNDLIGKKLKSEIHRATDFNLQNYTTFRKLFGDDWLNQEDGVISKILSSRTINLNFSNETFESFKKHATKEEVKRLYSLFKQCYVHQNLDPWTLSDHVRFYVQLKNYGENIKLMSSDKDYELFRNEHLDWTEKLDFYRKGIYYRIYPKHINDVCEPYEVSGSIYFPVVLNDSRNYNSESLTQSNCVKSYIGKVSSIIVSLRNGGLESDERATIEYRIVFLKNSEKIKVERIQTLGKYNSTLDESWSGPIRILDGRLDDYVNDRRYKNVKLKKICANGTVLESESEFDEDGLLKWSYVPISEDIFIF